MLIKSNYKDYYDYISGIYGIDPKVVYHRVCASPHDDGKNKVVWNKTGMFKPSYSDDYACYILAICGQFYVSYYFAEKFYFFEPMKGGDFSTYLFMKNIYSGKKLTRNEQLAKDILDRMKRAKSYAPTWSTTDRKDHFINDLSYVREHLHPTDINDKLNCPVCLIAKRGYGRLDDVEYVNVRLSDFGIGQIVSPNDMYIMISNFLTREKKVVDKRTDIEKIVGHGFDKKTSFRKM